VVAFASHLCWYSLLRRYSASRLGVLTFMTPMFGSPPGGPAGRPARRRVHRRGALILAGILIVSSAGLLPALAARLRPAALNS
jgi:hypothetical protein